MGNKRIFLFNITLLLYSFHVSSADENAHPKLTIPEGIVYKEIATSELQDVTKTIEKILSPDYKGNDHLFGKAVGCGPFLWKSLLKNNIFPSDVGFPILLRVPIKEKILELNGRAIRWQDQTIKLESYIRDELKNDDSFIIRRLNPEEMRLYWGMITYDIIEPIFIIESKSHKILIDFQESKVMWIDDFKDVYLTD